jgi:hypothetical protein
MAEEHSFPSLEKTPHYPGKAKVDLQNQFINDFSPLNTTSFFTQLEKCRQQNSAKC